MLDSDSQALQDPAQLFDTGQYLHHGSLFWPDYQKAGEESVCISCLLHQQLAEAYSLNHLISGRLCRPQKARPTTFST